VVLLGLLIFVRPIPAYENIVQLNLSGTLTIYGIPIVLLVIPAFITLCIVLSLEVLLRPEPVKRSLRELGRQRSRPRPWLLATAGSLWAVTLLVAYFVVRVIEEANRGSLLNIRDDMIGLFDLFLAGLIAAATLFLGQAIVAYEVFTGRVLPRRALQRHWRSVIILAAGFAIIIGWSIAGQLRPIYSLLLTMLLMVTFYALYSWRSFAERDQFMQKLRPFVSSQRLLTHLIHPTDDDTERANALFRAICRDVVGTERALLLPLGPLAPMTGDPMTYPNGAHSDRSSGLKPGRLRRLPLGDSAVGRTRLDRCAVHRS
jgi:hypothetical protein